MVAEVVDASVLAALLFAEPEADRIANALKDVELLAPSLIRYELASVCLKKCQRVPDQRGALLSQLGEYRRLRVLEAEVPAADLALIGEEAGVSAYDSAYLWVSLQTAAPLRTLDRKLAAAVTRVGVALAD